MEFNSDKNELNLPADETEMSELLDEEADDEE